MAMRKIGNHYYYYFKDEKGGFHTIPLAAKTEEDARKQADAIAMQRRMSRMKVRSHMAYATNVGKFVKSLKEMAGTETLRPSQIVEHDATGFPFEIQSVGNADAISVNDGAKMTFDEMFAEAQKYRASIGSQHRNVWRRFADWCAERGVAYVQDVTPQMAQEFMQECYGEKKGKTYNTSKGLLNIVYKSALVSAGMTASPFSILLAKPLKDETHHRDFTMEECQRIMDNACPYWKCLSMISLYTGLRLESCRRLSPSMIKDDVITIMPGKTARFKRAVAIPVMPELKEYLQGIEPMLEGAESPYCSAFKPVEFWKRRKVDGRGRITEPPVYYFAGLLESLGICDRDGEKASFHSFRCTFITMLSKAGIKEEVIRGIVGHTSKGMTDLYNHDTESAKAIRSLPKLGLK